LLIGTLNAGSWIDQRYFRHAERAFLGEDYACNCASRVSRWPDIFYGTRNGAEGFYSANCR
ncbi:MAG: hypothetical protein HY517_03360, partial [Candidatus Aenigmarchaeota archaeon]|nr:hypothetical protein [Candidatus Aenigmarchaeota archaeon]